LHRLSRRRDPADDEVRGAVIDANHQDGRDIWIAGKADELFEMGANIGLDLPSSASGRDTDHTGHQARDPLGDPQCKSVYSEHQHVVSHARVPVSAPIERQRTRFHSPFPVGGTHPVRT
jgi:hypothetical protein